MKILKKLTYFVSLILFTQCATTTPIRTQSYPAGTTPNARVDTLPSTTGSDPNTLENGCPMEKIQWMYASKQFDLTKQKEVARQIAAAAQTDANTLDRMASNNNNTPLYISSSLKTTIDKLSLTRTAVSEEFYKEYINSRLAMCAIVDAIRNGSVKKEESSKIAGKTFKDVEVTFGKLKD